MIFTETEVDGVFVIEPTAVTDERGFFAVLFHRGEFTEQGLDARVEQLALSSNRRAGTLRGMHYQVAPHQQTMVVRCARGAAYDVIVDLRPHSRAYLRWSAFELSERNRRSLYLPGGIAHGFQTLVDETEVCYSMSSPYDPSCERGLRWNDPTLSIAWPRTPTVISRRDAALPLLPSPPENLR